MFRKLMMTSVLAGAAFLAAGRAYGQTPVLLPGLGLSDEEINLLRKDIRSHKKQIVAANLNLTETEALKFWPIYDQYTAEMTRIADKKVALIKDYAANYNTMTDEQADTYIQGRAAVEESAMQLRLKYMPIFRKVLSAKTAARYTQIEWRLGIALDMQLNSEVPIIEP